MYYLNKTWLQKYGGKNRNTCSDAYVDNGDTKDVSKKWLYNVQDENRE